MNLKIGAGDLAGLATAALWGAGYVLAGQASHAADSWIISGGAALLGSAICFAASLAEKPARGDGWWFLTAKPFLLAAALGAAANGLLFYGLSQADATLASLIYNLEIAFVLLITLAQGKTMPRLATMAWIATMIVATTVLVTGGSLTAPELAGTEWALVLSTFVYAAWYFPMSELTQRKLSYLRLSAVLLAVISASNLAVGYASGHTLGELQPVLPWVAGYAVVAYVLSTLTFYYALARVPVWKVSAYYQVSPVATILLSLFFAAPALNPVQYAAAAVLIASGIQLARTNR